MNGGKQRLRFWVSGCIVTLAAYFIWRNWDDLQSSLAVVRTIPGTVFAMAIFGVLLTFVLAAMSYRMLLFRRVRWMELLLVEFAAAFINRIVPSGLGGLGVHGLYLRRRKHNIPQATAIVSVNNVLGIVTHLFLFAALLVFVRVHMTVTPRISTVQLVVLLGVVLCVAVIGLIPSLRRRLGRFWRNLRVSLARYRQQPHRVVFAALALAGLTLTNVLVLYALSHAVGIQLAVPQIFMVYSMGVLFGTLLPTPGGLVGVEAGLAAGFVAYGVPADTALAAALAYRLVTYWFPLMPGAVAFGLARRHNAL